MGFLDRFIYEKKHLLFYHPCLYNVQILDIEIERQRKRMGIFEGFVVEKETYSVFVFQSYQNHLSKRFLNRFRCSVEHVAVNRHMWMK